MPAEGFDILAKVRSTRPPVPARLFAGADGVYVDLVDGEAGVAPGQACVFFADEDEESRVLGGGFIARAQRSEATEAALASLAAREMAQA